MKLSPTLFASLLCFLALRGRAQASPASPEPVDIRIGLRATATRANTSPGTCGCFWLTGGAGDAAVPLWRNLSGMVELAGNTTGLVPGTTRGLSTLTLLAGPEYTIPTPRRQALTFTALAGAVRGFDAEFRRGLTRQDTATAFAFAIGGAYVLPLYRGTQLRIIDVQYVGTALPNGSDNRQHGVRLGAGLLFHPRLHTLTR